MTTADAIGERRLPGNADVIAAVKEIMSGHNEAAHLGLNTEDIQDLVMEHRELYDEVAPLARDTNAKVTLLVDDMYGSPHPTAADPDARKGGWVPILRAMQQDGVRLRKTWDRPQWFFFGAIGAAFISTCGAVIVAVVGA